MVQSHGLESQAMWAHQEPHVTLLLEEPTGRVLLQCRWLSPPELLSSRGISSRHCSFGFVDGMSLDQARLERLTDRSHVKLHCSKCRCRSDSRNRDHTHICLYDDGNSWHSLGFEVWLLYDVASRGHTAIGPML